MTKSRQNNLIITLAIFIVLIGAVRQYIIMKSNEPVKKGRWNLNWFFAADSGQDERLGIDKFKSLRTYTTFSLTSDSFSNIKLLEKARQKLNLIKTDPRHN